MSVYCDKCTQTPELLEDSEVEKIWLCPNHGVIARQNIPCKECGKASTKRPFNVFAPTIVFECLSCKHVVFEARIEHSDRVKKMIDEKKSACSGSKADTPCTYGDKHNKSVIPCTYGSNCWSVKKGKCPYKH